MVKEFLTSLMAVLFFTGATSYASDGPRNFTIDSKGRKTYWSTDGKRITTVNDTERTPKIIAKNNSGNAGNVEIVGTGDPKYLNIEIRYDENMCECEVVGAGALDFTPCCFLSPDKNLNMVEIPSGIDAMICVWKKNNPDHTSDIWVAAKDIRDLKSGDKVVFDIEECVHKISYDPLGPDGKRIDVEKKHSDGSIEPATLTHGFALTSLNHVNDMQLWMLANPYRIFIDDDGTEYYERFRNIYFNSCGPDFYMTQHIVGMPSNHRDYHVIEMPVYVGTYDTTPSETILRNNPDNYRDYVREWTRSPFSSAQYDNLMSGTNISIILNNNISYFQIGEEDLVDMPDDSRDVTTVVKVCANTEGDIGTELGSMALMDILPESDAAVDFSQGSMWWKPSPAGRQFLGINVTGNQTFLPAFETFTNFVEGNYNKYLVTLGAPNPWLALDDSKITGRMGNNTPIISMLNGDYHLMFTSDFVPFYIGLSGRYGECNGMGSNELIEETNSYVYDENNIRKDIFTYDNVLIDGEIEGSVTAELGIKKGEGMDVDFIPPVLTFLGMHDVKGNLTDRFETATDGTVEFYAGDFYFDFNWSVTEYENYPRYMCREIPDVKVEYAPYQTDNFTELTVTEVPEKYFYPGWGNYYTVPLKDVSAKSANAWFDLRISLEDEAGNTHVQTISPAFRINDASGVETVCSDTDSHEPVYYDMMGRRIVNPADGIFIERRGNVSRKVMK